MGKYIKKFINNYILWDLYYLKSKYTKYCYKNSIIPFNLPSEDLQSLCYDEEVLMIDA